MVIFVIQSVYRYGYLSRRERYGEVELLLQERAFQLHLVVVRYNLVHLIFSRVQLDVYKRQLLGILFTDI